MYKTSEAFNNEMNKNIRGKGKASLSLGVINHEAQANAKLESTSLSPCSDNKTVLTNSEVKNRYAFLNTNYCKADGGCILVPEYEQYASYVANGSLIGTVDSTNHKPKTFRISFAKKYHVQGLTIQFAPNSNMNAINIYGDGFDYDIDVINDICESTNDLGSIDHIDITPDGLEYNIPIIDSIKFGFGVAFTDDEIKSLEYTSHVSPMGDELPSYKLSATLIDKDNRFNIDSKDSIMNQLDEGQDVTFSIGLETDDGIEYVPMGVLQLKDFSSSNGTLKISAVDKFSFFDDDFVPLSADMYVTDIVDSATQSTLFSISDNIMPSTMEAFQYNLYLPDDLSNSEMLQLLGNAFDCVLTQDRKGRVCYKDMINPMISADDFNLSASNDGVFDINDIKYGNSNKVGMLGGIKIGYSNIQYKFAPKSSTTTKYAYHTIEKDNTVSAVTLMSGEEIEIKLNTLTDIDKITIDFLGSVVQTMCISGFRGYAEIYSRYYYYVGEESTIETFDLDFKNIDTIIITFDKHTDYVYVGRISLSDGTPIVIREDDVFSLSGDRDDIVSTVKYQINEKGETENSITTSGVWINEKGKTVSIENPILQTQYSFDDKENLYYAYYHKNYNYDIEFRGDPRIDAGDTVYFTNEFGEQISGVVEDIKLTYNGAFKGSATIHRMTKE